MKTKWIPVLVLFLLVVLLFADGIFSDRLIVSYDDKPHVAMVVQRYGEGGAGNSGWNSGILAGVPGTPYPYSFRYLGMQLFGPSGHLKFSYFLSVLLSGWFFYLFLGTFSLSREARLFGAIGMMFSNSLITHILPGHLGKLMSFAWVPLVFWALRKAVLQGRWPHYVYAGAALGMSIQGTGYEMSLFFALLSAAYFLFLVVSRRGEHERILPYLKANPRRVLGQGLGYFGTFIITLLLAAVVIPGFLQSSDFRSTEGDRFRQDSRQKWEWATQWSLPPEETIDFVLPGVFGWQTGDKDYPYWGRLGRSADNGRTQPNLKLNNENVGMSLFLLLLLALIVRNREWSRETRFWFWALLAGLALSLGKYLYLPFWLFHQIPYLDSIRNPNKFVQIIAFAAAVLGAFGFDYLFDSRHRELVRKKSTRYLKVLLGVLAVLGLAFIISFLLIDPFARMISGKVVPMRIGTEEGARNVARQLPFIILKGMAIAAFLWYAATRVLEKGIPDRRRRLFSWAVIAVLAVELLYSGSKFVKHYDDPQYFSHDPVTAFLAERQAGGRVFFTDRQVAQHYQSVKVPVHNLEAIDLSYLSSAPGRYATFFEAFQSDSPRLLAGLGVRYLVSLQSVSQLSGQLPDAVEVQRFPIGQEQYLYIHELTNTLPRAYLAPRAIVQPDAAGVAAYLASTNFRPGRDACLEAVDQGALPVGESPGPVGAARITERKNNLVRIEVETDVPAVLVLQDNYHPQWSATMDGSPVPVYPANVVNRAVPVPAGKHVVEFVYRPDTVHHDVTLFGTLLVLAVFAYDLVERRRRRGSVAA